MDVLILRLDAPLMSFGGPIVDRHGIITAYPAASMITGLIGNALGYDHIESEQLQRLQERLEFAVRQDRQGSLLQDYQTVDLSSAYMRDDRAWTTRGELETRKGGSASSGTHIRLRDYWADAVYTIAITLTEREEKPTLDDLARAIAFPQRPLFIGRKSCPPASPLAIGRETSDDLVEALRRVPLAEVADDRDHYRAWWSDSDVASEIERDGTREDMRHPVTDERDWRNQIHVGQRWLMEGDIEPNVP